DPLHDRDRARGEAGAPASDAQPQGAGVRAIDIALDQTLPFQAAQHLRGHLDVGAGERGEDDLRRTPTLLIQPPGAGEKHELDVGEIERGERLRDASLPTQRRVPEQESGALARVKHQPSANSTSAASTCGKSALISGPICGPRVSPAGPVISIL